MSKRTNPPRAKRQVGETAVIQFPDRADLKLWLNRKRRMVHVYHRFGTSSGRLKTWGRGSFGVWIHGSNPGELSYVTFSLDHISEIHFTPGKSNDLNIHIRSTSNSLL